MIGWPPANRADAKLDPKMSRSGIQVPSGLANMARRAARHRGELRLLPGADGGTHLVWDVSATALAE